MFTRLHPDSPATLWCRFAAAFSLLCVLSALFAPVAMLAQDVRSGKLGGVCSMVDAGTVEASLASGSAAAAGAKQCEFCGVIGLVLPVLPLLRLPCFAGHERASAEIVAIASTAVAGLRFSRGPPLSA